MKKLIVLSALISASMGAFATTQTTAKQWEIDFSGKPPFKRTLVEVNVVDAAQAETAETALVNTTDFSGKPPFKRRVEKLVVVDAAALEQTEASSTKVRSGRPPFKRN